MWPLVWGNATRVFCSLIRFVSVRCRVGVWCVSLGGVVMSEPNVSDRYVRGVPLRSVVITHDQCVCGHWKDRHEGGCTAIDTDGNSETPCDCRYFRLWAGGGD